MRLQFDTYIPLDSENLKSETTPKQNISEIEFTKHFSEFKWSEYPASPTLSVYSNFPKLTLWISLYGESETDENLYIIGYHKQVTTRGFLGLGKSREKEKITTYFAVGNENVKNLYNAFFNQKQEVLEDKLVKYNDEIKF